jgi:hypothetical protein
MQEVGDYICIGGQKIPISHDTFPFSPALGKALGMDEDALRATYPQLSICYLPLSVRAVGALMRGGILTFEDVNAHTDKELLALRNFGKSCLAEIHSLFPDRVRVREEPKGIKEYRIGNPERFAEIVKMRREGYPMRRIARCFGISPQRVNQLVRLAEAEEGGEIHIKGI